MTFMPWSDEIAVGISDVDEQHHWLVDRINQLHTELSEPPLSRCLERNHRSLLISLESGTRWSGKQ